VNAKPFLLPLSVLTLLVLSIVSPCSANTIITFDESSRNWQLGSGLNIIQIDWLGGVKA
jgi:hypothetical protein